MNRQCNVITTKRLLLISIYIQKLSNFYVDQLYWYITTTEYVKILWNTRCVLVLSVSFHGVNASQKVHFSANVTKFIVDDLRPLASFHYNNAMWRHHATSRHVMSWHDTSRFALWAVSRDPARTCDDPTKHRHRDASYVLPPIFIFIRQSVPAEWR